MRQLPTSFDVTPTVCGALAEHEVRFIGTIDPGERAVLNRAPEDCNPETPPSIDECECWLVRKHRRGHRVERRLCDKLAAKLTENNHETIMREASLREQALQEQSAEDRAEAARERQLERKYWKGE